MIQFHPTGLIIPGSVVAGALLEEGLRGAGAHLFNGDGERYMLNYAPDVAERATRDVVSRSSFLEMTSGRACPEGGVHIDASHLGADFVLKNFPGMAERCRQFNYDLARGRVPISPTAHFVMGGAVDRLWRESVAGKTLCRRRRRRRRAWRRIASVATGSANRASTDGRRARRWRSIYPNGHRIDSKVAARDGRGSDGPSEPDDEAHERIQSFRVSNRRFRN